jgi:DNA-binding MarR family transcriptional regulator
MSNLEKAKHGRLYSSVARHMRLYISRKMNEDDYDIRTNHLFVMLDIMHSPGTSLKEIACRLDLDKPTITKTVKKLLALGYIVAKEDEFDKRVSHLYLSGKSDEVLPRVKKIMKSMRDIIYKDFSEEEISLVNSLMQRMNRNLLEALSRDL